jgi:spore coat polysaccharide biosynthesis protein SpsF
MRRVIIVQARMTSTRLRGKILADLSGRPLLAQEIRRLKASTETDEIVIATTVNTADDPVVDLARAEGVRWFRGDEQDVLGRFAGAAREAGADLVVRVTADCPLIDAGELDRVVRRLREGAGEADYAANVIRRTFPRGLDTEAMFRDTLDRTHRMARSQKSREHVTWFLNRERPEIFARLSIEDETDNSDLRWTVDTPEDLDLARKIYQRLGLGEALRPYHEVLAYVRAHPEISAMNSMIVQKNA